MELEPTLTGRYRAKVTGVDRAKRKSRLSSLLQAVFVIAVFLLTARSVTVLVLSLREEPVFTAPKTIYLPQRELEHQMAVAEFQNAAATPATIPALTTESLLATMPALPQIPNVGRRGSGSLLKPGMCLAIEPMINLGSGKIDMLEDGWTAVTRDRKPSAHFEHTVLVTNGEPEILTIPKN